jgi:hypothetical protein
MTTTRLMAVVCISAMTMAFGQGSVLCRDHQRFVEVEVDLEDFCCPGQKHFEKSILPENISGSCHQDCCGSCDDFSQGVQAVVHSSGIRKKIFSSNQSSCPPYYSIGKALDVGPRPGPSHISGNISQAIFALRTVVLHI